MARQPRLVIAGLLHHVTQRGNNRREVFLCEEDRLEYMRLLQALAPVSGVSLAGYCLMPNHIHLVLRPAGDLSMAGLMRQLQSEYAVIFNRRHGRVGHLWHSRYFSCVLEGYHALNALRYVDRNPVAADLVGYAWEWRWSSAKAHCLRRQDEFGLLSMDWLEWRDWPRDWTSFIGEGDAKADELIRKHTKQGKRLTPGEEGGDSPPLVHRAGE